MAAATATRRRGARQPVSVLPGYHVDVPDGRGWASHLGTKIGDRRRRLTHELLGLARTDTCVGLDHRDRARRYRLTVNVSSIFPTSWIGPVDNPVDGHSQVTRYIVLGWGSGRRECTETALVGLDSAGANVPVPAYLLSATLRALPRSL